MVRVRSWREGPDQASRRGNPAEEDLTAAGFRQAVPASGGLQSEFLCPFQEFFIESRLSFIKQWKKFIFVVAEVSVDEHAAEQWRHGPVQRDVIRSREDVAANKDGGQHRRRELGTPGGDQEDLEAHEPEASGPGCSATGSRWWGDGRQVLRDLPHPGLLPAIQEEERARDEGGRQGLPQRGNVAGKRYILQFMVYSFYISSSVLCMEYRMIN